MTPDDRRLFERLFCAVVASAEGDGPFNWGIITRDALNALSAIRTAEAETPDAEQPNPWAPFGPGEGKCAFGYPGGSDLQARLKDAEARLDRMTQKHDTATSDAARFLAAVYEARDERDAAEGIIHALCDERASRRSARRVDAERARLLADDLRGRKPARKVLPAGHVPERLMVGMVLHVAGEGVHHVNRVSTHAAEAGPLTLYRDRTSLGPYDFQVTLAAPFEVPND